MNVAVKYRFAPSSARSNGPFCPIRTGVGIAPPPIGASAIVPVLVVQKADCALTTIAPGCACPIAMTEGLPPGEVNASRWTVPFPRLVQYTYWSSSATAPGRACPVANTVTWLSDRVMQAIDPLPPPEPWLAQQARTALAAMRTGAFWFMAT